MVENPVETINTEAELGAALEDTEHLVYIKPAAIDGNDRKMTSFFAAFYNFVHVPGFLDDDNVSMNEGMNGEVADMQFAMLVAKLVEHFDEERTGRRHG